MKKHWLKVPFFIALATGFIFLLSAVVMLLWNGIMPSVLHLGAITLWQAMGILLLCKILFSGFKGRRHWGGGCGWKKRIFGKWHNRSAEEKEKFMTQYHCCKSNYTGDNSPAL